MSQVQKMEQSRIAKVWEGLGMFFSALSVNNDIVEDPEELVKKSGIKELVNSSERIKNIESMFEDHGTTLKQVRAQLKSQERNSAPEIKNSIIKTNIQEIEEEDLER